MSRIVPLEFEEQAAFFDGVGWLYKTHPDFNRLLLFATFNGEIWRSFGKVEKAGFVKGVVDVLYLQPRGVHPFFASELKRRDRITEKDGGLTPAEQEWLKAAKREGAFTCVAYGADELLQYFANYMGMEYSR